MNFDIRLFGLDYSLSLRLFKPFFVNVLLEHGGGGLPHVLPFAVHLNYFRAEWVEVEGVILSL